MKPDRIPRTLRDLISERVWIPEPEVVLLFTKIAEELDSAHTEASLHGDVKPEKIVRSRTGHYSLTDFGVSRLGTARYMSPERARKMPTDARSDIYSLGVVLYETATGRLPFEGMNYELLKAHVTDSPPLPRSVRPEVSAGLQRVILTAMAKNPAERYQRASEFASALRDLTLGQPRSSAGTEREAPGLTPVRTPTGTMSGRRPAPAPPRSKPRTTAGSRDAAKAEPPAPRPGSGDSRAISSGPAAPSLSARTTARPAVAPPAPRETPLRRPRLLIGAGAGILTLVIVVLVLLLSSGTVKAPSLLGLHEDDALELTRKLGFTLAIDESRDDTLPARAVAGQLPAPGARLRRDDTITVVLSTGLIEIPAVLGIAASEAAARLARLSLPIAAVDSGYSDAYPSGAVADLQPGAGTRVAVGSAVRITVTAGRATCSNCGATRTRGARFCTSCGQQFAD